MWPPSARFNSSQGDNDPNGQLFAIDQSVDFAALHLFAGLVTHGLVFGFNHILLNSGMPFNPQPTAP